MDNQLDNDQPTIIIQKSEEQTNELGIVGFVLAILSCLLSPFTFLFHGFLFICPICWLLGLIFSLIGLFRTPKGLAQAGSIISALPVLLLLGYVVIPQISTPIRFDNELKTRKAQVIERIKDIRTAQRAFKSKYQRFTGDFDTLAAFVLSDTLELERKIVDEDDSVAMAQLKKAGKKNIEKFKVAVIDTIFAPKVLTAEDVAQLRYIPGTGNKAEYIMEAGIITTESKVVIPVVECRAPYKSFLDIETYRQEFINLVDDEVNNFNRYPGVKFGSMEAGNNEAGNWEE